MLMDGLPVLQHIARNELLLRFQGKGYILSFEREPPVIIIDMGKGKPRFTFQPITNDSLGALKSAASTEKIRFQIDHKKDKITDFFTSSPLHNNSPALNFVEPTLTDIAASSPVNRGFSNPSPVVHNGCHYKNPSVSSVLKTSPSLVNGTVDNSRTCENWVSAFSSTTVLATSPSFVKNQPKKIPRKVTRRRLREKLSHNAGKLKITRSPVMINRHLTEYYPIRRSCRQTRSRLMKEKQAQFEEILLSGKEDGLKVVEINGKGRGVIATKSFQKGEFVVEYCGELISFVEAKRREVLYSRDQNTGCYMYYFIHNNRRYCVDATEESGRLGRLINHSRNGNLVTKSFHVGDAPHLILVAKQDISPGEELLYDYGDRSKASLQSHPWLAT